MIITTVPSDLIVEATTSVVEALRKINENRRGCIVIVDRHQRAVGVATDGDLRRWLLEHPGASLKASSIAEAANREFVARPELTSPDLLKGLLNDRVSFIPLLDQRGRVRRIAWRKPQEAEIAGRHVGEGRPVFIVAEIGTNHNGDAKRAAELVRAAADAGADCAKFQLRDLDSLYRSTQKDSIFREDLGSQYTLDLLTRFQLEFDEMLMLFELTRNLGMAAMCTPWDSVSANRLIDSGIDAIKVASADLTNDPLLGIVGSSGLPIVASTGMSTEHEILHAIEVLRASHAQVCLLHCNSAYPPPLHDLNLRYISRLREISGCVVGYSGHERGNHVVLAAVALGASIIEKHLTLDRTLEGNDHRVSLLPSEFAQMVAQVRDVENALGTAEPRTVGQGERMNREALAKSLVASRPIRRGTRVTAQDVEVRSPGRGLQPNKLEELLGVRLMRDLAQGDFFYESDLREEQFTKRQFSFSRPWGVPVRYHDAGLLSSLCSPDFLEFHFSYMDLDLDPTQFLSDAAFSDFIVHAPEQLRGDLLVDLSSSDPNVRSHSRDELRRVGHRASEIRNMFGVKRRVPIVTNVGGFSERGFLPLDLKHAMYERVAAELESLQTDELEYIIQTMPPFPWHFGGQRHHNLFVDPTESAEFCARFGVRLCLDVSHTALACNWMSLDLNAAVSLLAPHVAHLHLADSAGVDSEGLQIGEGSIEWEGLAARLRDDIPLAPFIPEIWQGHKDNGAGFLRALELLEAIL